MQNPEVINEKLDKTSLSVKIKQNNNKKQKLPQSKNTIRKQKID